MELPGIAPANAQHKHTGPEQQTHEKIYEIKYGAPQKIKMRTGKSL
jgi:hypothetical protein